jgi:hypothetical protein
MVQRLALRQGWQLALRSWNGPYAEEHDFSLEGTDVEVKTTVSERRVHMIGSLTQMLAKPGRSLYVLSLQFTRSGAGPGMTLTESVAGLTSAVSAESALLASALQVKLQRAGWRQDHAPHYRTRWSLRSAPKLVAVDEKCPLIVPGTLASLGADRISRIVQLSYRVDLEGLGSDDGSAEFLRILP